MREVGGAVLQAACSQVTISNFCHPFSELVVMALEMVSVYQSISSLFEISFYVCVCVCIVCSLYKVCTMESVIVCTLPFISFLCNRANIFECDIKGCYDSCPAKPFLPGILLKIFTVGAWLWCLFVEINSKAL